MPNWAGWGDSPRNAIAAYDLDIDLWRAGRQSAYAGTGPARPSGAAKGSGLAGPRAQPLTLQPGARPLPVGFRIDDGALTLGKVTAHITGRVQADAETGPRAS